MRIVAVAAGALFDAAGAVLVAERPPGKPLAGLWEFPGGKIEATETAEAALRRELEEELGIHIADVQPLAAIDHAYPDFHLHMQLFAVRAWTGMPHGRQGQPLRWVAVDRLAALAMPPADYPLIPAITDFVNRNFPARHVSNG
ncbi:8-oxo-dGTP diphosphatase MutT [Polymorphobacter sp.]|uniref:8-oxo-dGTP diphosphatase MutT n=1 Tax=Polymorphobacter sp. TaxID=1909290 RepID=UPI003F71D5A1